MVSIYFSLLKYHDSLQQEKAVLQMFCATLRKHSLQAAPRIVALTDHV